MPKTRRRVIFGVLILAFFMAALLAVLNIGLIRGTVGELIYDSKNHNLPCEKLPASAEAMRVMSENAETVQRIEQVNPGFVGVHLDTSICPGKADLLIWFGSHQDRAAIEKIIDGDTFFGIPYRLINV